MKTERQRVQARAVFLETLGAFAAMAVGLAACNGLVRTGIGDAGPSSSSSTVETSGFFSESFSASESTETFGSTTSFSTESSSSSEFCCVTETSGSSESTTSSATFVSTSTSGSTGNDAGVDAAGGDSDASCKPPPGGLDCTPGRVACGDAGPCAVPASACCESTQGLPDTCQAAGASCQGTSIECNEAADCPAGEVCCIASDNTSMATVSCQELIDGKCPTALIASAQVCRSDNECATGSCRLWSCVGHTIEACSNPVPDAPALCTLM